jgi:hypothetical protein
MNEERLKEVQKNLEQLIVLLPTGRVRNLVTDANIAILLALGIVQDGRERIDL